MGGRLNNRAWLVAAALVLSGCTGAPAVSQAALLPGVQFALDRLDEAPAETAPSPEALVPHTGAAETELRPLRLFGKAVISSAFTGAANVHDGQVTGSPVMVTDATSGRLLGKAVSYYDGSFMVDLPIKVTALAALVSIELVDAADPSQKVRLMAPIVLRSGVLEDNIVLTTGTTALVGFLTAIAAEQAGAITPGEPISPDPYEIGPGRVTQELSNLIAVFEPETRDRFAMLAESSPELKEIQTIGSLATGIQKYVGRLTRAPRSKAK